MFLIYETKFILKIFISIHRIKTKVIKIPKLHVGELPYYKITFTSKRHR